ncbi:MAG: cytochrome c [Verrucomicrobiales bacterium]
MNTEDSNLQNIDYQEAASVADVHASVKREKSEPSAGQEPVSLWFFFACAIVLMVAAGYSGGHYGGFRMDSFFALRGYQPDPRPSEDGAAGGEQEMNPELWIAAGQKAYNNCQVCHGPTGGGIPALFPPLAGSEWVTGSTERLAMVLLKGVMGPTQVNGQSFNGAMPAWEKALNDEKMAQVMSFVRNSWGNSGSIVTEAMVSHAREKYADQAAPYTQAQVYEVAEDAMLPGEVVDPENPETWVNLQK